MFFDLRSKPAAPPDDIADASRLRGDVHHHCVPGNNFYYSINLEDLRCGDVILYDGSTKTHPVSTIQRVRFSAHHSLTTHVGIFDDSLTIWEANPNKNVSLSSISDLIRSDKRISVKRPIVQIECRNLSKNLLDLANSTYRVDFNLGLSSFMGPSGSVEKTGLPPKYVVCSTFVSYVLRRTTKASFFHDVLTVFPAHFASSDQFVDIPIRWQRIALSH
jgi:hypothetical protein